MKKSIDSRPGLMYIFRCFCIDRTLNYHTISLNTECRGSFWQLKFIFHNTLLDEFIPTSKLTLDRLFRNRKLELIRIIISSCLI